MTRSNTKGFALLLPAFWLSGTVISDRLFPPVQPMISHPTILSPPKSKTSHSGQVPRRVRRGSIQGIPF
jgi:hypothetical protein